MNFYVKSYLICSLLSSVLVLNTKYSSLTAHFRPPISDPNAQAHVLPVNDGEESLEELSEGAEKQSCSQFPLPSRLQGLFLSKG